MKQRQQIWASISCYAIMIVAVGMMSARTLAKGTGKDGNYFTLSPERTKADAHNYITRMIGTFTVDGEKIEKHSGSGCAAEIITRGSVVGTRYPSGKLFQHRYHYRYNFDYSKILNVKATHNGRTILIFNGVKQTEASSYNTDRSGKLEYPPSRWKFRTRTPYDLDKALAFLVKKCGGGGSF